MPDSSASPSIKVAFNKPFPEQVRYFQQKLNLPAEAFDSIRGDQHDRAFIVAGAMKADLVADIRNSVQKAIEEGKSIGQFRKEFKEIVAKHGWTDWTGSDSKAGIRWRTRMIYKTNLDTSYAAGRWQQMTDPDVMRRRPIWRYVHTTKRYPRLIHKKWHNVCLPAGHPWFIKRWGPNDFGCNCYVQAINQRELEALGKTELDQPPEDGTWEHVHPVTGEITQLPVGVGYGWDYTPGKTATETAMAARINRLEKFESQDNAIARLNVAALINAPLFSRFMTGDMDGEFPVAVLNPVDQQVLEADSGVVLLSQHSLAAHLEKHPEIGLEDYRRIQQLLDQGTVWQVPGKPERLVYITLDGVTYRAALKKTADGRKNYFLSLFRVKNDKPPKGAVQIR